MIVKDKIRKFPISISKSINEYIKASEPRSRHQLLLDIFQSCHSHFLAVLLGFYKSNSYVDEKTEEMLFRHAKSKNSFGVYVGIFRSLPPSLIKEYHFDENNISGGQLVSFFEALKNKVINKGHDTNLEALWKREQPNNSTRCEYVKVMDTLVEIRNIMAHKEGKAKDDHDHLRDWPLNDEYFTLVNPWLESALIEILDKYVSILEFKPVSIKIIDAGDIEITIKSEYESTVLVKSLNSNEIEAISGFIESFINSNNDIYPYYIHNLPQVEQHLYKKFLQSIEAKEMEVKIRTEITERLCEHSELTPLDLLVLVNQCAAHNITKKRLNELISDVKKTWSQQARNQTTIKSNDKMVFNAWWLRHFSMMNDFTMQSNWRGDHYSQTAMHHALWGECEDYFKHLVSRYLETEQVSWSVSSNRFQQGRMSSIYWGQASLTNGVLENGISIGFAVSKNMKFFQNDKPKNPDLRRKLTEPSALMWLTFNNNLMEDLGELGNEILKCLNKFGGEIVLSDKDTLQSLDCVLILMEDVKERPLFDSYRPKCEFITAKELNLESQDEKDLYIQVCSPIVLLEDLITEDRTDPKKVNRVGDIFSSFIQVVSSVVIRCDSWARENGVSPESVKIRRQKMKQLQTSILTEVQHEVKLNPSIDPKARFKELGRERGLSLYRIKTCDHLFPKPSRLKKNNM